MLTLVTFSISASANQSTPVTQGEAAPYAGVLLDNEKANEVHVQLLERDLYKELSETYQADITARENTDVLEQTKINLLVDQNVKLADEIRNNEKVTNVERILIFSLGVVATVLAGSLINSIAKKQ